MVRHTSGWITECSGGRVARGTGGHVDGLAVDG